MEDLGKLCLCNAGMSETHCKAQRACAKIITILQMSLNRNLMVRFYYVHLRKNRTSMKTIKQMLYMWYWITIMRGSRNQSFVITKGRHLNSSIGMANNSVLSWSGREYSGLELPLSMKCFISDEKES